MNQRERTRLLRELDVIKERLRSHATKVTYGPYSAPSLSSHIADIKRRGEIEELLTKARFG